MRRPLRVRYVVRFFLACQSDYGVAKILHVERATVSAWKKGGSMGDDTAVYVAELLDKMPAVVLADMHAERTKSPHLRRIWQDVSARLSDSIHGEYRTRIM